MKDRITIEGRDGAFGAYIVRPKTSPDPAVVVLHEVFAFAPNPKALGVSALGPDADETSQSHPFDLRRIRPHKDT